MLPKSGNPISFSDINAQLGFTTQQVDFDTPADVRLMLKHPGNPISLSDGFNMGLWYEFYLYGASGGKDYYGSTPGPGGYAYWGGFFDRNTTVNVYVGGKGTDGTGFYRAGGAGGGGTAIVVAGVALAIAGGGGGSGNGPYTLTYNGVTYSGGPGGGTSGIGYPSTYYNNPGSQTSGGSIINWGQRQPGSPGTGPATGTGQTGGNGQASNGVYAYAGGWGWGSGGWSGNSANSNTDNAPGGGGGGYYGGAGGNDQNGSGVGGAGGSGFVITTGYPAGVGYTFANTLTTAGGTSYGNGKIDVYRMGTFVRTYNYTGAVQSLTII